MMIPGSRANFSIHSRLGALTLAAVIAVAGMFTLGGGEASAAKAKVKIKQPKCGKLKNEGKIEQCKNDRKIRKAIGNAHFFGTMGGGESTDIIYCENGIHQNEVRLDDYGDRVRTVGWRVQDSVYKSETNFSAILFTKEGKADFYRSVRLKGEDWQIGAVKKKGKKLKIKRLGEARKDDARQKCSDWGVSKLDLEPIPEPEEE